MVDLEKLKRDAERRRGRLLLARPSPDAMRNDHCSECSGAHAQEVVVELVAEDLSGNPRPAASPRAASLLPPSDDALVSRTQPTARLFSRWSSQQLSPKGTSLAARRGSIEIHAGTSTGDRGVPSLPRTFKKVEYRARFA